MYKLFNDKQIFRFTLHLKAFFFVPAGSLAEDPAFMHYLFRKYTWFTVPLAQGPRWETPLALKFIYFRFITQQPPLRGARL